MPTDKFKNNLVIGSENLLNTNIVEKYISDLIACRYIILLMGILAYGLSIMYFIFFRFLPECMVWIGIVLFYILLGLLAILSLDRA